MKKKKMIIIILGLLVITIIVAVSVNTVNKNQKTVNFDVISDYLEIEISENAKIEYKDEHDSFFGEGFTIMRIIDENLLDKIKKSSNWREETDEYTSEISIIKNDMNNSYNEISQIQNYYWIYKHNYRDINNIKYIDQMVHSNLRTASYFVGIYDIDNDVLYYYHMDM